MALPAFPRAAPPAWAEELPGLIASAVERWGLTVGDPYPPGATAWVAPAGTADGQPVVLKVMWPHPEGRYESAALRLYDGDGAIRLLDADETGFVLLLERCDPGTPLGARPEDEQLTVALRLLRRIWRPAPPDGPFEDLAPYTVEWADAIEERFARFRPDWDPGLVAEAARVLREYPGSAASRVLLHQDFHPGNVLASEREPWLVIDPKPLVGDPAYDAAKLVIHVGRPDGLGPRLTRVAAELELPPARVAAWGLARRLEEACWMLHRGDRRTAEDAAAWTRPLSQHL
jgi:streptomycin 6-kinase